MQYKIIDILELWFSKYLKTDARLNKMITYLDYYQAHELFFNLL